MYRLWYGKESGLWIISFKHHRWDNRDREFVVFSSHHHDDAVLELNRLEKQFNGN